MLLPPSAEQDTVTLPAPKSYYLTAVGRISQVLGCCSGGCGRGGNYIELQSSQEDPRFWQMRRRALRPRSAPAAPAWVCHHAASKGLGWAAPNPHRAPGMSPAAGTRGRASLPAGSPAAWHQRSPTPRLTSCYRVLEIPGREQDVGEHGAPATAHRVLREHAWHRPGLCSRGLSSPLHAQ